MCGWVFNALQVPAGWLLGALIFGIVCSFAIKKIIFSRSYFSFVLAIIGTNIGFTVILERFVTYGGLIIPLLISIFITIFLGMLLGKYFQKWSGLNANTAFFCCLPGGASEVIAVSEQYGADQRIVAAFHTTRITLFVMIIPLIAGLFSNGRSDLTISQPALSITGWIVVILTVGVVALLSMQLGGRIPFPGAIIFVSIGLGFAAHTWVIPQYSMPSLIPGIAQGLMGAVLGMRFDRETLSELLRIGKVSALAMLLYFVGSLSLAALFFFVTSISFSESMLGIVPAGAAEMAATALSLQLDSTLVATLQMLRVLSLFVALPFLIKWFAKPVEST
ncbi:AbrB family transcriptional regulator [Alkalicoccobacillus porphyridii]|uniref:AbrB family transcriptional regulator n=2 Tax=Alkalicoccobacillus porphyridii TaxID=2597270 RepID=A0A553ZU69_9BACI|nr:AbrB family transcriptional regulator [Alkalicoccobacillus porphyridii]